MKKAILAALLCLPILAGCTAAAAPSLPIRLSPTKETENDILRCYPLDSPECRFFALGDDLVMTTPEEILKFSGKQLIQTNSFSLPGSACRIAVSENGAVCLDSERNHATVLSKDWEETHRYPIPKNVQGTPLLCSGGNHLYFCTLSSLMCLDCNSGICKTIREGIPDDTEVTGILEDSGLILCTSGGKTSYYSVMDGTQQAISPPVTAGARVGSRVCLNVRCGSNDCLYLGSTMLPLTVGTHFLTYVPASNAALVFRSADASLILYDLTTGNQISQICTGRESVPTQACAAADGRIFFVQQDTLYQWMPESHPARDPAISITALYTADAPSRKGLEQCRLRAGFLEQQYGIRIAMNTDATTILPAGVQAEPEHISLFLRNALDQIEQGLLRLPAELIRSSVQNSGQTTVCIVRSIQVDGESRRCHSFWVGKNRYILLAAGENLSDAILRTIWPLMDQQIYSRSDALDRWEQLNPAGFQYGSAAQSGFADAQGCLSAADDRASVLLAAIRSGNRELFCDAVLQNKLRQLSLGIREAFPSVAEKGALPWEQYLWSTLA